MTTYKISLRQGTTSTVVAEDVHVSAQGHIKFLNGKGKDAKLVAFFNPSDVISIQTENQNAQA